ncbi:MAG TPA: molecular chaperone DnaK [Polyangiaceae bacterium]|nr:molecular chaperone DnaK [Polyangiaceae bacterium]
MTKTPERVIGIDLGTTNSCVAVMDGDVPRVIPNRGGYKTTPSMVAVTQTGKRLVGHIAKRQAITNAENTVHAAKRLIGRPWNSPQVEIARQTCSYELIEGPHNDARIRLRDGSYSVPELSSMILQEMKIIADDDLGAPVGKAVVTVPAYFNDNQRQATKDAGTIAGLDIIRIINEPTAAALAYGFGKSLNATVAVYDLGGGTFDVSILDIADGVFKVIATTGDTFLGGEDFDLRIIDWLVEGFLQDHGVDLRRDRMALQRLKDAAEKAKCELSGVEQTEINLPFIISTGRNEALHLQRTVTRATLESLTQDLIGRTVQICRRALEDADLDVGDIDDVLLVGGMTRMPAIQTAVEKLFGKRPNQSVHPDEVVALGAAIQGASLLDTTDQEVLLLDVTPHALGILTAGGIFEELIAQNTTVPTMSTKVFTTSRDNQTAVKILVLQNSTEGAQEMLGEFALTGLRRAPRGEVELEVTFKIDTDGIVSVSARDLETSQAQSIQVLASSGLTSEEVSAMISSAQDYLVERRADEALEVVRQKIQTASAELERLLPQVEKLVGQSEFGRDALTRARAALNRSADALAKVDAKAAEVEYEALERTLRMFRGVVAGGT